MRRWLYLLLLLGPLVLAGGCGGDREKGIYKGKDRPVPPEQKG